MRLIVAIATALMLNASPVSAAPWWQPSPISVALTVGHWLVRDQVKVYYLQVRATGADQQQARDQAFKLAVEQAVGSLLVSETEVRNNEVVRNEIVNYSSGYVHDFAIVSSTDTGRVVEVVIDVWVKHSAIADRVLHISRDSGTLESERISEQIRTLENQRQSADRLLMTVLSDFPGRAFDTRLEPTRVMLAENRQTQLQIPVVIGWNSKYVASLREVITQINQRPDCDSWFKTCRVTSLVGVDGTTAFFDDTAAYDLMHREMVISQPQILVEIRDYSGIMRFRQCYSAAEIDHSNWASWHYVELGGYKVMINPARNKRFNIVLNLDSVQAKYLSKISVSVVRRKVCSNK